MSPEKTLRRFLSSAKGGKMSRTKKYMTKTSQQKEVDLSRLAVLFNNHEEMQIVNTNEIYNGVMCDVEFVINDSTYQCRLVKEKIPLQASLNGEWGVNPYSFKKL